MSNTKSSMENWRGQNEISVLEGITAVKDEDNMASDSSTALVTQQSVKAYVDTQVSSEDTLAEMNDTTLSSPADNDFLVHDGTDWKNESASTALGSLGVTSTAAELNIMDGSATTQATVTLAGTDGVVISDVDVMKQALVSDFGAFVLSDTLDDAVTINESGADKDFRVEGSGAANALFVQGSDGNVGIGTTEPLKNLHIRDASAAKLLIESDLDTTNATAELLFKVNSIDTDARVKAGIIFDRQDTYGRGDLHFAVDIVGDDGNVQTSDAKLTIDQTGKVGIGTTAPDALVDISKDLGQLAHIGQSEYDAASYHLYLRGKGGTSASTAGIGFSVGGTIAGDDPSASIYCDADDSLGSGSLYFNTNPDGASLVTRMMIQNGGNVGINLTNPETYGGFTVKQQSNTSFEGIAVLDSTSAQSVKLWVDGTNSYLSSGNTGADPLILNAGGGNVGIQETTPSKALDIKNGASGGDILCYDIYTHDGGVETSDERLKENIKSSVLGLEFIDALNPVSYKWKDVDEIVEKKTVEKQKTVKVEKEVTRTEIVEEDGKYIQKEITETQEVDEPVFDEVPLYGEDGKQLMRIVSEAVEAKEAVLDEDGNEIEEAVEAQDAVYEGIVHKVPVMEEVEEIVNQYDAETYTRTHYGMIAQEVGQVLEDVGLESKDFAGYVYEEDRDRFGLRYNEFISPLIKAVQELSAKVEALENQ